MNRAYRLQKAFTIIEMIIGLLLSSIVVIMLSGSMSMANKVLVKLTERGSVNANEISVFSVLDRLLTYARSAEKFDEEGNFFLAKDGSLKFISLIPEYDSKSSKLYLINIFFYDEEIIIEKFNFYNNKSELVPAGTEKIKTGNMVVVRYLDRVSGELKWSEEWDDKKLPLALKLSMQNSSYFVVPKLAVSY